MNNELINKSIDFIIQNMDRELSVKDIAAEFHFSESYFSRSFKAATGESVYEFIKRLKMEQSAVDIKLTRDRQITDIGLDYGYSASNYSSAFKKHHSISPARFRRAAEVSEMQNPFYPEGLSKFGAFEEYEANIKITELEDIPVIYERIVGNYIDLKEKWPLFISAHREMINEGTRFIERFYSDPAVASRDSCIYDICISAEEDLKLENSTVVGGGRYAIYRYEGLIRDIFCSVQGVFSVWLPKSGYVMDKRYALNIYPRIEENSDSVVMDLCIPVK